VHEELIMTTPDAKEIRILLFEVPPFDADQMLHTLRQAGIHCLAWRAATQSGFNQALAEFNPDIVLSGLAPSESEMSAALRSIREKRPHAPLLLVSDALGAEGAIEAVKHGAADCVLKKHLARLPAALERALAESRHETEREATLCQLKNKQDYFNSLLDSLKDVVWSIDAETFKPLYLNRTAEKFYGHPVEAFFADPELWYKAIHPDDRAAVIAHSHRIMAEERAQIEYRILRPDGAICWVRDRGYVVRDADGKALRIDGIATDITEQRMHEERMLRLNHLYTVLSGINTAIVRVRDQQTLFEESCRIAVELGQFRLAWIGLVDETSRMVKPVAIAGFDEGYVASLNLPLDETAPEGRGPVASALRQGKLYVCNNIENDPMMLPWRERALRRGYRAMAALPLRIGEKVKGCLALYASEPQVFEAEELRLLAELSADIGFSLDHIATEERLRYLALYDDLTGLANRTLFSDRLSQLIERGGGAAFAVLVFDIDRFTQINETLTYEAGDYFLRVLADRLRAIMPETALARPSGDDIGLCLSNAEGEAEVVRFITETLLPQVTQPFHYDDQELRIALKLGIACYPADGKDAETLLNQAELAHREAKNVGESFLFFAPDMNVRAAEFLVLESRLRRALENEEFTVYYQPKIDLVSGKMYGVEAVIRWRDPEDGLILPGSIISVLEETGMILEVGRWMIEEAGRQYLQWVELASAPPKIAVNVSPIQLRQKNFVSEVEAALKVCLERRGCLELEITESAIMHDVEGNIEKLRQIRDMGVEISIDDFGTGYSSLSYLNRLPLTRLKIDRSFIVNMTESADSLAIVSSIISLAHTMNLKVTAEGVETAEQIKFLRLLRCDEIQGFVFSPPLPAGEILPLCHKILG
jgi:diguanylate cyclase (GGDEF)-like protein/PAS domain S-box-containing protein